MNIIDPHLHLFDLSKGKYDWLKPENAPKWPDKNIIHRNFTEADLQLTAELHLAGFVHIEAGYDNEEPVEEVKWLEQKNVSPFKSIAGVNLLANEEKFAESIDQLKALESVIGVRDILDDNAFEYLSNNTVLNNLKQLSQNNLLFELQMPLTDINSVNLLTQFFSAEPNLQIVINHAGFPSPNSTHNEYELWLQGIAKLSQFKNCTIKCSGFEMADRNYTVEWQNTIIDKCINSFGEERVMLASNFPLCLFSKSYQQYWLNLIENTTLSNNLLNKLCYDNAQRTYQITSLS